MAEVVRCRLEDLGFAYAIVDPTLIFTDNDATLRIASDAASAKRAMHILRRLAHTRYLTENEIILAATINRNYNPADTGTHYLTRAALAVHEAALRGTY